MSTNKNILFNIILLLSLLLSFNSCKDDDNNVVPPDENPDGIPDSVKVINRFIHDNMNFAYYWNKEMPDIDPMKEPDSKEYFYKLLYDKIDRWSFITDDYEGLKEYFSGIRKSVGYSIRLYRITEGSNDLVAFIEYVNPNTPASEAGLKRTDMFYKINGTQLTVDNYKDLLSEEDFYITLGELQDDLTITPLLPEIHLVAEKLTIDPILYHSVIEHAGEKIGYLVYNSFVAEYDDELQQVFGEFKNAGIDDLVLDLRYNSGGSVNTAILIASMIAPASEVGSTLLNNSYNDNLTAYFEQQYPDNDSLFTSVINSNPNNLNLSRYVALTTFKTASASEMVIYTLMPYMNVIQIGEQTHGKYYGSITIYDQQKKHNWAIQPIVMRAENANNSIDYSQGLIPDTELHERYEYQLGDPREEFLAQALYELTGEWPEGAAAVLKAKERIHSNEYFEEADDRELKYNMFIDFGKIQQGNQE